MSTIAETTLNGQANGSQRIRAGIEALAVLVIITVIGLTIDASDPFMLRLRVPPFAVLVLLVANRYGSPAGPTVATLCALLHLAWLSRNGVSPLELYHLGIGHLAFPLLYVLLGLFVARGIDKHRARAQHHEERATAAAAAAAAGAMDLANLERGYRELEGRLLGRADSIMSFNLAGCQMVARDPQEIITGLGRLVEQQLEPERFGVWQWSEGRYRQIYPVVSNEPLPAIGARACELGRVVSLREPEDGATTGLDGIIAGTAGSTGGRPTVVVVVQEMELMQCSSIALQRFAALLHWADRALKPARTRDQADQCPNRTAAAHAPTSGVLLAGRLLEAQSDAMVQQPSIIIAFRCADAVQADRVAHQELALTRICCHLIRPGDVLAAGGGVVAVALPGQQMAACQTLRRRIAAAIDEFAFHPNGDGRRMTLRWVDAKAFPGSSILAVAEAAFQADAVAA